MTLTPLRHVAALNPPVPEFSRAQPDDLVTFIPLEAVWADGLDTSRKRPKHEVASGYTRFREGDILVPKITPTFQADRSTIAGDLTNGFGAGTTELHVLRPGPHLDVRFANYVVSSREFLQQGTAEMIGVAGQKRVPEEFVLDFRIHLPTLAIQQATADFLDIETSRIDALIAKKRHLSALLDERSTSHREACVTGPGRSTGIPSLEKVPSDWDVLRNKVFLREMNDLSPDGLGEMLSVSHLTGVTPRSEKTVYMFEAESTVGYKRVQPGDLVINTMWAWMGAAGVSSHDGIVSPAYGVYRFHSGRVLPEFYEILVRAPGYIEEMTRFSRGVTSSRLRLYPDEFLRLLAPVPPIDEQRRLVSEFATWSSAKVKLVGRLERQIVLLQEHRQALITAAVTGQLDVTKAVA